MAGHIIVVCSSQAADKPDRGMTSSPLRIALVAPPWFEVPPTGYGGIEEMVAGLANGLTSGGHHVTLLAAGEDRTDAEMIPTFDEPPDGLGTGEQLTTELVHASRVARELAELDVDIVHDHTVAGPALATDRAVPTIVTVHGPIDDAQAALYAASDAFLVAISEAQRASRPTLRWVGTVHNGIDVDSYPFDTQKEDRFLFLGRMSPDKGVEDAIAIAEATRTPLVIAAKCDDPDEQRFFAERVEPRLNEQITYVGAVHGDSKLSLLASSKALLFPIQWEEPFGMVMAEALAAGTPVIARGRGSVPEIVRDGRTGFVADHIDELIDAAKRVDTIDPHACRADALARFDSSVMTDGYERVYRSVIAPDIGRAVAAR
jgi:glycosyltransferase involved in cell wall biosynthesis